MARAQKAKNSSVKTASVPSPIGGLNARDSIAGMPPTDALILDNWFCNPSEVDVRNGYVNQSTGLPGWVESILPYSGLSAVRKLFAASVTGIYDCTIAGAVGAAVVSGLTNARFQWINFATAGSTYLYGVNGADNPVLYNGTTWQQVGNATSPISITGADPSKFIQVNAWQQRLYFTPINSTKVWYLPAASIGGAANAFDFGPLLTLGGYIMGTCTWNLETSTGVTSLFVVVSSEGEVLVYNGYDPTTTATFSLAGHFRIGRPVGRRFYCINGADIVFIGMDGAIPLSKALVTDRSIANIALTDKIKNDITSDVFAYANNFGWQIVLYPAGNKIIINVPAVENSVQYQYVMNTISGSWSTFGKFNSPWLAATFEFWEDNLYFGGNGYLAQCDTGQSDNGQSIQSSAKQAFNYFGMRGSQKMFTMVRPIFLVNGSLVAAVDLNVDFEDRPPTSIPSYTSANGTPWNVGKWNVSPWQSGQNVIKDWDTPNAVGFCAAPYIQVSSANLGVSWESTDFVFQMGGIL